MRTNGWVTIWLVVAIGPLAAQSPLEETVLDRDGRTVARVEWVTRTIRAAGKARVTPGVPTAWLERAAKADAYANLAGAAHLARIDRARRVDTLAQAEPEFDRYLRAYLRYATFGPLVRGDDGWAWIEAQVPLFGVTVADGNEQPLLGTRLYERDDVWAAEVQPVPAEPRGVLFDARETSAPGAFAPTVRDTAGRVVWHVECADRDEADAAGAVEYRSDFEVACRESRAGETPLVVQVVEADGPDLVVSVDDGWRLAPRRQAQRPGWWMVVWDTIRTITPVSPFQRACCVSTARQRSETGGAR